VEVQIDGLTVAVEGFGANGHLARSMQVRVHSLEVRDCAAAASVAAFDGSTTGGKALDDGKVLSCR
jgi:hypothetical protein